MSAAKQPTFFIVGAPKCGTTALYEYLRAHPLVYMPSAKEPHYFAEDFPKWRYRTTESDYLDLFKDAPDEAIAIGEASPWYLYSRCAIENISRFSPDAKIIVMLRNPVELVHAQHAQNVYNFDEDQIDFEAAWRLEGKRSKGESIPKQCRSVEMLYYSQIGRLGEQLERAKGILPEEQILCLRFDEFISETEAVYERVLQFLNLPSASGVSFKQVNANRVRRFVRLAEFVERPPSWLQGLALRVRLLFGVEDLGLYRLASKLTTRQSPRSALSETMRQELIEAYRGDVEKLSILLSEDFRGWLAPSGAEAE